MAAPPPPIALPPIPFEPPTIYPARRNVDILVVEENTLQQEKAYLMQADTANATHAYQKWPHKMPLPLGERGQIVYCQVLLRNTDTDAQQSQPFYFYKSDVTVAIKKLRKDKIQGNENPHHEIRIMQEYGNFKNVMQCYQALEDERHLYIIMLYLREGDLYSHITQGLGGGYQPPHEVPQVMKKIVLNLQYLQQHALVHRDLKPENCMLKTPWIVFIDMAMTLQAAVLEGNAQDISNQGAPGSYSYISPEVFFGHYRFNYKVDVWAVGCILWNLLTGSRLYHLPSDRSFAVFILSHGLENPAYCEQMLQQVLQENPNDAELLPRLQAAQVLEPVARDLLAKMLQLDPNHRPTLEEILQHPFFQS